MKLASPLAFGLQYDSPSRETWYFFAVVVLWLIGSGLSLTRHPPHAETEK